MLVTTRGYPPKSGKIGWLWLTNSFEPKSRRKVGIRMNKIQVTLPRKFEF